MDIKSNATRKYKINILSYSINFERCKEVIDLPEGERVSKIELKSIIFFFLFLIFTIILF